MTKKTLFGFEVPAGEPVYLPFHHAGFTGMTGKAGKSTAIEGAGQRSGFRVIAFLTKRGEQAFRNAQRIPLFFKERSDWRYVESLLEAELREDKRFERAWIIKVCRGTKGKLRAVWENVKEAKKKARKDSLSERVYTCLDAYFEIIVPELEKYTFSSTLELGNEPITYVMDLIGMSESTQAVIMRSSLEHIHEHEKGTISTVPEAWKFTGARNTPVIDIAERIIKQGFAVKNFLWVDSQDIASINPKIRGQIDNWVLGRQRYEHEIDRTLKAIPVQNKPTKEQIQTLNLGHFFVACEDWVKHVYALPFGVPEEIGIKVARGELTPEYVRDHFLKPKKEDEDLVWKERFEEEKRKREELEQQNKALREENEEMRKANLDQYHGKLKEAQEQNKLLEGEIGRIMKRCNDLALEVKELRPLKDLKNALIKILPAGPPGIERGTPSEMLVVNEQPSLTVRIHRKPLTLSQAELEGRIAIVYAEGLLPKDKTFTTRHLNKIMEQRFGRKEAYANFRKVLTNFVAWGFFEKVQAGKRWDYRIKMKPGVARQKGLLKVEEK